MKKILFSVLALLTMVSTASAQNSLTVPNVEISPEQEAVLPINIQLDQEDVFTAVQFNVELPSGISFVLEDEATDIVYEDGECLNGHTVAVNYDEGLGKALIYSSTSKTFKGTSGTLAYFHVEASADLEVGTTLTGKIDNIVLTPVLGEKEKLSEITFTITVGDGRIKFDEASTKLPIYAAGEKASVKMNRTIKKDSWSTIVLPFTLTKAKAEEVFGSDVKLAEFSGFEVDYGEDEDNVIPLGINVVFSTYTMTARKPMTGGKPFLIKTSRNIESFQVDEVTLVAQVADVNKSDENGTSGKFTGSLVKTVVPEDGLFIANNQFYYSTGQTNIKAFRGWFELDAVLGEATDFGAKVNFYVDGETSSIEGMTLGTPMQEGAVYTLDGRLVGKDIDERQLGRGMYIRNGKKFVVK